ncbi:type 2 isopentenyl-diphosphate Delta-isomerase [Methanobacterium petrolearium]|uniref:type 2 isopentenyl-diphosphate Delta-isomerase n=1 Tax=Methanobacterium petrolearium TaxID=710190 RepID=UPI001AE87A55|nr:type 2 isopentenyl-diphosphate Delta-isomerase [Methanobacterium petrolearium]MBP1945506.1 isopentenyl-diphosphate delta-isomerase [Methanobacterium petrolearium]BDZ71717.1 type 2 isopentenyl-diphosphate Delta-isomerase [Methanobacterium petrolearium]
MISDRKLEHLLLCTHSDVEYHKKTGFNDVELVHKAIPEVNQEEIDLSTSLFGKKMDAPIIITAITGGHPASTDVNRKLARSAQKLNIGMGLGSQRAAVENPQLESTYTVARKEAPDALLIGNIGAPQMEQAPQAAEMMELDAMAVHLNTLQEAIQPEGDLNTIGYIKKLQKAVKSIDLPVMVKETGAGISGNDAQILEKSGVAAIDVAGAGGTSWAAVEKYRSPDKDMGDVYWDWGIPTAASTVEVSQSVNIPIIASGGIRNGLDAVKSLALGADAIGMALPVLKASYLGKKALLKFFEKFLAEMKVAMFLVGANNLEDLTKADLVITGKTREWLTERGYETKIYARRSAL